MSTLATKRSLLRKMIMPAQRYAGRRGAACVSTVTLTLVTACSIGPKYHVPAVPMTPTYKETDASTWKAAAPKDTSLHGKWWEMFEDPQLNALEERVDSGNQTIAAAVAHYNASQSLVRQARSQYFPSVTTTPSYTNARVSATPYATSATGTTYSEYSLPFTTTWEPDFWGRVRKTVAANVYSAQSSAADLENARLLAHAALAVDYFQMAGVEAQGRLLDETLVAWRRYLDLTRQLKASGLGTDEALAAAESQLEAAQAQDTNLGIARSQYEHAIAVLMGESPSAVVLPQASKDVAIPTVPVGVPSQLLERRPDIATAERAMAAANAQIGVATTAYFPNVILSASGGLQSLSFADWLSWPARFWSIGPTAAETIFDAGLRKATVAQYKALYDESLANYRQTTLSAFQQVEDNLAALRVLSQDVQQQDQAVQSARRYLQQATTRNEAGLDPYLNVLTAQVNLLTYQQTDLVFQTQQRVTSVELIAALGGGWNTGQLPTARQVSQARKP